MLLPNWPDLRLLSRPLFRRTSVHATMASLIDKVTMIISKAAPEIFPLGAARVKDRVVDWFAVSSPPYSLHHYMSIVDQ